MSDESQDLVAAATEAHTKAIADVKLVGFELLVLVWNPQTGAFQLRGGGNATMLVGVLTRAAMALNANVMTYNIRGEPLPKPEEPPPPAGTLS